MRQVITVLIALTFALPSRAVEFTFNKHIRPILSENCFACHGPDAKARKSGLRLDVRDEAIKPAKSKAVAIVPGKPDASEVLRRITTTDADDVMPPPESHKKLSPVQIEVLRRWIAEGAAYQKHWSLESLVETPVPSREGVANPIDAFVLTKLDEQHLQPSPKASPETLIRRVSLDLTGLPPSPDGAASFDAVVDRLLASPNSASAWPSIGSMPRAMLTRTATSVIGHAVPGRGVIG